MEVEPMLILLGPSASGKTETAKIMINRYPISRVVTCTTRPKRMNEIDGFDYHFLNESTFKEKHSQGYFAETAVYNGYLYGTPLNELRDDKLIILEPQGLRSFINLDVCDIVAIYFKTQEKCRIERMRHRKDKSDDIKKRIEQDRVDFNYEQIEGLDLIVDTTNISLTDLADLVYYNYTMILANKKLKPDMPKRSEAKNE
jgi:guanylate kinase